MSDKRIIDIYYDTTAGVHRDSAGNQIRSSEYPYIIYKEKPLVNLRLVTDDINTPYTGIAITDVFSASIDDDFDHSTDLMCKTEAAGINVAGEFNGGNANVALGQFSIRLDGYNTAYQTKIGTSAEKSGTKLELLGFELGTGDLVFAVRMAFKTLNIQDDSGAIPPEPADNYWTKAESDARYTTTAIADARYVPRWGDQARWRWADGGWAYRFAEDDKWCQMLPKMVDGQRVIGWGEPKD